MPSYSEKLKDQRWQRKRLQLLEEANWKCQRARCESLNPEKDSLHIHHKFYLRNTDPWDYPEHAYYVVCEKCHAIVQHRMEISHEALALEDMLAWATYMLGIFPESIRSLISKSLCQQVVAAAQSSHTEFHPEVLEELFLLDSGSRKNK
jgi:hypothetical protein